MMSTTMRRISNEEKDKFLEANNYEWILRTERISETPSRWRHVLREHQTGWYLINPTRTPMVVSSLPPEATELTKRSLAFSLAVLYDIKLRGYEVHFNEIEQTWNVTHKDSPYIYTLNTSDSIRAMEDLAVELCGVSQINELDQELFLTMSDRIVTLMSRLSSHKDLNHLDRTMNEAVQEATAILQDLGLPT